MLKSQDSERNTKSNLKSIRTTDDDDDDLNHNENEADEDNEEQMILFNDAKPHRSQMMGKTDADNLQYEDPMVSELKQTEVTQFFSSFLSFILDAKIEIYFSVSQRYVQTR